MKHLPEGVWDPSMVVASKVDPPSHPVMVGPANRRAAKFPRRPALLPTRPREALGPSLAPEDLSALPIVLVS